jgi:Stealth protein CR2, conserved region 2/Stealth protein CR1, conserved region 1/Stealth protein CR4, conserved region 4
MQSISPSPIDIVYLWVNGNDPHWRGKRQRAASKLAGTAPRSGAALGTSDLAVYANVEGRFRDNDELRFSLRALERFFPAHGHIYIVTDAQTPSWLKSSAGLTIIDHQDLIPAGSLPTFDSGNIESYIHRIKGLSERYFYLNDDVFFGAPVHVNDWFWEAGGQSGVYAAWSDEPEVSDEPLRMDATSLENACRLSNQWLAKLAEQSRRQYTHTFRTFAHSPRPMLRSVMHALERQLPQMFEGVRSTVFRAWDKPTVVSDFVLRWKLEQGIAQMRDYSHMHFSTGSDNCASQLKTLAAYVGKLDFFCINDTTDDAHTSDPRLAAVRQTLAQMFPHASSFERTEQPLDLQAA